MTDDQRMLLERVIRIEERVTALHQDNAEILANLNGGEGVPWERSIRGRLHVEESKSRALEMLIKELPGQIRAEAEKARGVQATRREWTIGACILAASAVPAWIELILLHR